MVEALGVSQGEREAHTRRDHPKEAEIPNLLQPQDGPHKGSAVSTHPEDLGVSCANLDSLLPLEPLLSFNVASERLSLLVLATFVCFVDHDLVAKLVDVAVPAQVDE